MEIYDTNGFVSHEIFHPRDVNKPQVAELLAFIADKGCPSPEVTSNTKHLVDRDAF